MCSSPVKSWLYVLLILWLLLTVSRQVFDLIGKLWVPVAFNLLQTLSCITGLFAICQSRLCLLVSLLCSCVISLFYNTFILLWYAGVFGERSRPWLSAGLPYSYSFFLRHTPVCGSHFNLTSSVWVQSECVLPYYQIEAAQACLHIALAVATSILTVVFWISFLKNRKTYEKKHMTSVTMHLGGSTKGSCVQLNPPDSINDISSGYMNSSYESKEQSVSSDAKRKPYGNYERYAQKNFRSVKQTPTLFEPNNYSLASTRENQIHGVNHDEAWSERDDGSVAYSKPQHRTGSVKSFKQMKSNRTSLRDQTSLKNSDQYGSTVSNLSTFKQPPKEQLYQDVPNRTTSEDSVPRETAPAIPSARTTPDWIAQAGIPHPNGSAYSSNYSSSANHTIYEPVYRSVRPISRSTQFESAAATPRSDGNALSVADLKTTGMRLMSYSSEPRSRNPIVASADEDGGHFVI